MMAWVFIITRVEGGTKVIGREIIKKVLGLCMMSQVTLKKQESGSMVNSKVNFDHKS